MADPTQVVEQRVGFAPEVAPYAQRLLRAAQDQMAVPYQSYQQWARTQIDPTTGKPMTGDQVAQFTDLQKKAFLAADNLGPSAYSTEAAKGMQSAAQKASDYGYQPGQFANQFQAPQGYQAGQFNPQQVSSQDLFNYQMQAPTNVQGQQAQAAQLGASPQAQASQAQAAQLGMTPQMQAALNQYQPGLQQYAMSAQPKVATKSFTDAGTAEQYMSPYAQNVIAVQQREAQRAADIAKTGRAAQAVGAGAFGGSRQGVMEAEAARNLATQMGDIQATGSQAAFQQAQQQFNAEQGYGLSAQQANLQAGLTTGQQNLAAQLGTQQLGTQSSLQALLANQANQQAAAAANQQMAGQYGLQQGQFGQAANLQTSQQAQQIALANQQMAGQYGLQQGQFNQAAAMQNPQLAQQAMLANQQAELTTNQQNLQAQLGVQQLGSGQNLQAQLANQQSGLNAQQMAEQSRQFGAGQAMTSAQSQAQYGQAAQQLGEQSSQYGAGLGLQGLQAGMQGYSNLGAIGQNLYGQNISNIGLQQQYGTQQQQQIQNMLGAQQANYATAQNYPYKQMGFMSDITRGVPLSATGSTVYQQPPSMLSQVAGLGAVGKGVGLFAKGGAVTRMAKGGLVKSKDSGLAVLLVHSLG